MRNNRMAIEINIAGIMANGGIIEENISWQRQRHGEHNGGSETISGGKSVAKASAAWRAKSAGVKKKHGGAK